MLGATNIYYIWYGNWSGYATAKTILPDLISGLSGSPIYNINSSYYDGANNHVANSVQLISQVNDSGSQGTVLTDASVQTVVANAITNLGLQLTAMHFILY